MLLVCLAMFATFFTVGANAARIKDIASVSGLRNNQLVGYGLVVGLSGTGDKRGSEFTIQSMVNMLEKLGVRVQQAALKPKNVAAVMVTAQMPASARAGSTLDIHVSSLGDATSLLGGELLLTPLKGIDGNIYAIAQGSLLLGGFSVAGAGATAQKNSTTVAIIPNGASIEREVPFDFNSQSSITLNLKTPDFSTVMNMVGKINDTLSGPFAQASDASTIKLNVPPQHKGNLVPLLASIENIEITPQSRARVVVDEKTGTVVLGQDVQLSRVAITHGNLQILVTESAQVSQPLPFSEGQTVVVPDTTIATQEQNRKLKMVEGATLQELVQGLNALGATPRDLISVLRTLQAAGALYADLEVI
nr:flagellar basal body P-ring protein FlgI [Desulfovibrio inopinatus]